MPLLSQEGLVRDEPRRGTFVVRLTAQDVRDLYELRIALETTAVRLIMQQDRREPLAQIRGVIEDMRAVARDAPRAARQDLRSTAPSARSAGTRGSMTCSSGTRPNC